MTIRTGTPDDPSGARPAVDHGDPAVDHRAPFDDLGAPDDPNGAHPAVDLGAPVDDHGVPAGGDMWGEHDPGAAEAADRRHLVRLVVDIVVVGACMVFALWHMQPHLLLADTTPAGGDMGAHVWGPAYLRDQLLANGQIAGWSGDWYAGFPAYQFYMVVPSLMIVALNVGVHGWLGLVPAGIGVACGVLALVRRHDRRVAGLALTGAAAAFAVVGLPYGVAFKLVTVSGIVTLPFAVYAFGRLAGARFPTPAVMAVASLPFLFYRGFTIYGGNVASTLAGEFAFSISLSLAVVYLGVVFKGFETGRYRALAAVLLALTGLCHIIPAFWALGATALAVVVRFRVSRPGLPTGLPLALGGLVAMAVGATPWLFTDRGVALVGLGVVLVGAVAVLVALWLLSESVRWLTPTLAVGGLLSMWWVAPFYLRRDYLNDMGWEKLPYADETIWDHLLPRGTPEVDLRWAFALALVGAVVSIVLRSRVGVFLLLSTLAMGVAFVVAPEGRLWNGRLLPFYYLSVILLAGMALPQVVRTTTRLFGAGRRGLVLVETPVALGALAVVVIGVGVPMGQLPFSEPIENGHAWPRFSPWQVESRPASFVTSWARWNYSGYERKDAYREYHGIVSTMAQVGEQRGCGRAFWEYEKELDRYGTPMALMLLPHWTDGCIGSMEGLYFEASATTPFHFLTQVELSTAPSAAQRDLPYGGFDISKGVAHLQMMGVRYYMATSDNAVDQARTRDELTEVAADGPWVVFEVAGSEVVSALDNEPVVVEGVDDGLVSWVEEPLDESGRFGGPAIRWFTDPERWPVPLASSGPSEWQRVEVGETPPGSELEPVEVSNIDVGQDTVSFEVDQVGVPVLVKMSYFPNWQARGAEGPYRVAPNFMVVVPNDSRVELTYGRTGVEWFSYALTLLGVIGLVVLARRPLARFPGRPTDTGIYDDDTYDADDADDADDAGRYVGDGFDTDTYDTGRYEGDGYDVEKRPSEAYARRDPASRAPDGAGHQAGHDPGHHAADGADVVASDEREIRD